jgi:O-antigen ligase
LRTIAFGLSLAFIFIVPWEGVIEYPSLGSGAKMIGFLLAAVWVLSVILTGRLRRPGPFQIMACLFVLWNAVSVFWSHDPTDTAGHVVRLVQLLIMVFILWDLYTTRAALLAGLQVFILGEFVAIGSALTYFMSGEAFYSTYQRFSPSEQSNPDGFGVILALGLPLAWYLASSKNTFKMSPVLKFVNYAFIPAAFLGITLSGTRTALIASIVGVVFGLASLTRIRRATRIAIFLFLVAAFLFLLPQVQTLKSFQRFGTTASELTEGNLNHRTITWALGFATFEEHPLLGIGSNQFLAISGGRMAHNTFLSVLVELGLVGFALFGIILTIAAIQALRQPTKWDTSFWLTVLLTWAICASSLTYEHRKATWLFLSLVVASAAVTSHRDEIVQPVQRDKFVGQFARPAKMNELPQGD